MFLEMAGGIIAKREKMVLYDGKQFEMVNMYRYLGISMSTRCVYTHALEDL